MKNGSQNFIGAALILIAFVFPSCAPKDDVKKSEAEVDRFHQRWNQWDFTGVYNNAHGDFRSAQDPQKTIWQLKHNRNFYGAFKSATQKSMNVSSEHSEKDITFKYSCGYEHGNATEAFTFRMTGGKPLLMKYGMTPENVAKGEAEELKRKTNR